MGWTGDFATKREAINDEMSNATVVASNWSGSEWYAAVRSKADADVVFGVVLLTRREKGCGYLVKSMDEGMGPYYFNASAKVIAALTPTTNEQANEWRAKCAARLAMKARMRKPAPGMIVTIGGIQYRLLDECIGRSGWMIERANADAPRVQYRASLATLRRALEDEAKAK